jgi:hypothetical protein
MAPAEMGRIWAAHFHNRHHELDSYQLCTSVSSIVKGKALMLVENRRANLLNILGEAGIPIYQFDTFESEQTTNT